VPNLVVMTGLPCSGKSTVAYGLAARMRWPVFSVDPIDSAMRVDGIDPEAAGSAAYGVAARLASEQLGVGLSVIVDGCNADKELQDMWLELSGRTGARLDVIECVTAEALHRARVAGRVRGLERCPEVSWDFVEEMRGPPRRADRPRRRLREPGGLTQGGAGQAHADAHGQVLDRGR
jgi:predicted kinase